MKKAAPTPDLAKAFSSAPKLAAVAVADNPDVEADAEVRLYLLLKDIAGLYCTDPEAAVPTLPLTQFSSEERWGPYQIKFKACTLMDPARKPVEDNLVFDNDIYKGMLRMMADLSMTAPCDTELHEVGDNGFRVDCRNVDDLLQICARALQNEDCPGDPHVRAGLLRQLRPIVMALRLERAQDGLPYADFQWDFH